MWIRLVVLLLMATVIAAAVVYWKVAVTGAQAPHSTETELSTLTRPSEIAIQAEADTYVISSDITKSLVRKGVSAISALPVLSQPIPQNVPAIPRVVLT
jgi:hypothetical protein